MQAPFEQYVAQVRRVQELARPQAAPGPAPADLPAGIRARTDEIRTLRAGNDWLLHNLVLDRDPAALTPADAAALREFSEALMLYARHLDIGAAYRTHRLLYRYAALHGDEPLMVEQLYGMGLALYYLNIARPRMGINLFGAEVTACFTEGAARLDRFADFDAATQDKIIRCLGNRRLCAPAVYGGNTHRPLEDPFGSYPAYKALFDEAMAVINSAKYRAAAPGLPWNRYAYAMHYDRTRFLSTLRTADDAQMAQDVLQSAEFMYQWQALEKGDDTGRFIPANTRYRYAAARYHAGRLGLEPLVRQLLTLRNTVADDDYTPEGMTVHLRLPVYTRSYLERLPADRRARYEAPLADWEQSTDAYLRAIPPNEYSDVIADLAGQVLDTRLGEAGATLQGPVLNFLLWRHPPTYVHSNMVASLAQWLLERAADTAPAALAAAACLPDAAAAQNQKEAMARTAHSAGLYHDVGKCMLLQVVGLYARSLLDEERAVLRCHPLFGWHLLCHFPDRQPEAMAALYHHVWSDGSQGYPQDIPPLPPQLRWVVDLVAVADCLDSATDDIGRSYAEARPFAEVLADLRAGSGTRYAAWAAALLDDPGFCAALERRLRQRRADLYCEACTAAR